MFSAIAEISNQNTYHHARYTITRYVHHVHLSLSIHVLPKNPSDGPHIYTFEIRESLNQRAQYTMNLLYHTPKSP